MMPPESALVVTIVISAFLVFMATLAGAMIYTWLGDRNAQASPAGAEPRPDSQHDARDAA